jgi:hypothetical protein
MMGKKIESMISHIRAQTVLGCTMCININSLQLSIGTETPLFQSHIDLPHIDTNWLTHIREFMKSTNTTMKIRKLWRMHPLRVNDKCIMEAVLERIRSPTDLRIFNNWRKYFSSQLPVRVM